MLKSTGIRVDVFKPFPLILIHTPFGLKFFDSLAKTRPAKVYARLNVYLMPIITAAAIILIGGAIASIVSSVAVREFARDLGPQGNLLLPGLNPMLPVAYTLIALIVSVFIHETGHGVVARVYNIKVESTGIATVLGIPVGAFVNIEKEELAKSSLKHKSAVLTAGPLNNIVLAAVSLMMLYVLVSTLTPISGIEEPNFGVAVTGVKDNSLAKEIGISNGATIQKIAGEEIHAVGDLNTALHSNLGKTIGIAWLDKEGHTMSGTITIPSNVNAGTPILGVTISSLSADPKQALEIYKTFFISSPIPMLPPPTMAEGIVPFSDLMAPKYTSSLFGPSFPLVANMLYWLWFINFNLGIFNALPIGPLDGGQLYGALIESRSRPGKTRLKNLSMLISLVMLSAVIMSMFLPYFLF